MGLAPFTPFSPIETFTGVYPGTKDGQRIQPQLMTSIDTFTYIVASWIVYILFNIFVSQICMSGAKFDFNLNDRYPHIG